VDVVENSPLPTLSFIRHLTLQYLDRSPPDTTLLTSIHQCSNLKRIAIYISSSESEERHLWLSNEGAAGAMAPALDWLDSEELHAHFQSWSVNSPSVSRFQLTSELFVRMSYRTFANLLSCFPAIESLVLDRAAPWADTNAAHSLLPPRLRSLSLMYSARHLSPCVNFFFTLLRSLPVIPILKSLKVEATGGDEENCWGPIVAYIRETGEGIECLDLDVQANSPGHRLGTSLSGKF
jgi:hypothetical protein